MDEIGKRMNEAGKPMDELGKKMEALGKQMEQESDAADRTVRGLIRDALARAWRSRCRSKVNAPPLCSAL
jgi:hypothetical protein